MAVTSIRVLVKMTFPGKTIRLWDGSGPFLDQYGEIWSGATLAEGLDQIESAMNGEAATLTLAMSSVDSQISDLAYTDLEAGNVIDAPVQLMIQSCDEFDQPMGAPEVRFTGLIDNLPIDDTVSGDGVVSRITAEVRNRFTLRKVTSGSVLSDVDQKARSAILNPAAALLGLLDRFCERVSGLSDKVIRWPVYT